jgi:Mn2+/Fe2+ NRAMP family transporter
MNDKLPKVFITLILLAGMFIAVFMRGNIIYSLILAQASTIITVPLIAIGLIVVLNDKKIMGDYTNNWWQNILAVLGLLSISLMIYFMFNSLVNSLHSV